jgi:enoyl-CoA hydratase/carnithine racemase
MRDWIIPDGVMSHTMPQASVLFREQATSNGIRIGFATLNVPAALNTLSVDMIRALAEQFRQWESDQQVACVMLDGAGERAFCAGADVRSLRTGILGHAGTLPNPSAQAFFSEEYRLDYLLHNYRKPILVWGSGIVMGGGVGLMVGASHRVVTEKSRIAMPEVSIGLFPDVGGSWFLPRMPGRAGLFLGLTGASLNAHDALTAGLADHFVRSTDFEVINYRLGTLNWSLQPGQNAATLSTLLNEFSNRARDQLPPSNLVAHAKLIESVAAQDSVASAYRLITGYRGDDPWLARAAATLAGGSPSSIVLIWELWRRAANLGLADVFRMELIVALQCCQHPDFAEGVRALLVDKDNAPNWSTLSLETGAAVIADYFVAPWPSWVKQGHPLADLQTRVPRVETDEQF